MIPADRIKDNSARAAAALVEDGMCVGLGSGSTAKLMVQHLAERVTRDGLRFRGVPTSKVTADLARSLGIELLDLDECAVIELNIDGADEIDPQFRMIKGLGGALLREKIVASVARRRVTIVGARKRVARLGVATPVPVEVSPFGLTHIRKALDLISGSTRIRLDADGSPFQTDGGNRIVDCSFEGLDDPADLDRRMRQIPGVFETGLFLGLCDTVVVGREDGADLFDRPA
jgi:ribose 5-phosphate isomerase A